MTPETDAFIRILRENIRKDMNNYADDVATGACQDFHSYKELCGVIRGLALAERHILDLIKTANKANGDLDDVDLN
jgi:hypothetical protein